MGNSLVLVAIFLSTPSARRATGSIPDDAVFKAISIHALREEGDVLGHDEIAVSQPFLSTPSARRATEEERRARQAERISIHALREEGDAGRKGVENFANQFLSTPSARRATPDHQDAVLRRDNFYPRPPRGGRRCSCP